MNKKGRHPLLYKIKFKLEEGHRLTKYICNTTFAFRCDNKIVETIEFEMAVFSNTFICPECHKCVRKL